MIENIYRIFEKIPEKTLIIFLESLPDLGPHTKEYGCILYEVEFCRQLFSLEKLALPQWFHSWEKNALYQHYEIGFTFDLLWKMPGWESAELEKIRSIYTKLSPSLLDSLRSELTSAKEAFVSIKDRKPYSWWVEQPHPILKKFKNEPSFFFDPD